MSYIGNEPIVSATRTITEIIATAGQTVFNVSGGYTVGFLDVFINGAQLQTSDFTASNGTTVTLSSACAAGDDVRLVAWGTFSVASVSPDMYSNTQSITLPLSLPNNKNSMFAGPITVVSGGSITVDGTALLKIL